MLLTVLLLLGDGDGDGDLVGEGSLDLLLGGLLSSSLAGQYSTVQAVLAGR